MNWLKNLFKGELIVIKNDTPLSNDIPKVEQNPVKTEQVDDPTMMQSVINGIYSLLDPDMYNYSVNGDKQLIFAEKDRFGNVLKMRFAQAGSLAPR